MEKTNAQLKLREAGLDDPINVAGKLLINLLNHQHFWKLLPLWRKTNTNAAFDWKFQTLHFMMTSSPGAMGVCSLMTSEKSL
jgi:hypothetical protein